MKAMVAIQNLKVRWHNWRARGTKQAYEALTKAMREDRAYAYSWHCNIAMPILDGSNGKLTHEEANQIAEKLMAHLFGIKNSREPMS